MGLSINGQLSYGIIMDEGYEYPWDKEEYEGDINYWWLDEKGFNITEKDYKAQMEFEKENPVPIELVNCCSCDYPINIISIPSSTHYCSLGDPTEISPDKFIITIEELKQFNDFIEKYLPEMKGIEPKWYLSSHIS